MKSVQLTSAGLIAALALSGCASTPMHPMVQVVPPANKPFQVFQADQAACEDYAHGQVANEAEDANGKAVGAALLGAALGAGLGAAAGGGHGAGIGAAIGGGAGTAVGAGESSRDGRTLQVRYDNAYVACMSSKGNIVPQVHHAVTVVQQPVYVAPPPTVVYTAPPPPAYAPPGYAPPPGAVAPPPNMPAPQ
ncbi:MAG TPA: glycine zipper family protein [Magnetospirillaceae bacterium]|nr:glycine zipper family protein [Magnetospirillaceae bacterium]